MRAVRWVVRGMSVLGALLLLGFFVLAVPGCQAVLYGDWLFSEPDDPGCDGEPDGPAAVVVFDLDSGAERWSRTVGRSSELVAHEGVVIVGGYDGVIRGLDRVDGDIAWCVEVDDAGGDEAGGGDIALADDTVGVLADARTLIGLDPVTGRERWRTSIDQPAAEPSVVSTIAPGSDVFLFANDGLFFVSDWAAAARTLVAFEPGDGTIVVGASAPASAPQSSPFGDLTEERAGIRVRATSAYVENRQERVVTVFDAASGEELWWATVPGYVSRIAEDAAGAPIVVVIDQTGGTGDVGQSPKTMLTAYDGRTGARLWQRPTSLLTNDVHPVANGVILATAGSRIVGIDVGSGAERWSADHGSPGKARPYSVAGNYVSVVPTGDGGAAGLIIAQKHYRD